MRLVFAIYIPEGLPELFAIVRFATIKVIMSRAILCELADLIRANVSIEWNECHGSLMSELLIVCFCTTSI